jgi:hypothetical protein
MAHYPACFDHMLAAWNETEPEAIRAYLNVALTEDDPTIVTTGIDAFEANVRDFRQNLLTHGAHEPLAWTPTTICFATAGRYAGAARCWCKASISSACMPASQRVQRVLGFFGPLPPLAWSPTACGSERTGVWRRQLLNP